MDYIIPVVTNGTFAPLKNAHFVTRTGILCWNNFSFSIKKENPMSTRYKIRQKLISIGDDFWIEDDRGQKVFKVDGKVLRIRKTLVFEDLNGKKLCQIQERLLAIKDTMVITDEDGKQMAAVKKALIAPLRDRWHVTVKDGPDLNVQGNILDHEYSIKQGLRKVADVSKKWFRITDTYGVEVEDGQNDILILAITIVIDMMAHEED